MPTREQYAISEGSPTSRWALVARSRADFGELANDPRWDPLDEVAGPVWTDDYSNVFRVIRR